MIFRILLLVCIAGSTSAHEAHRDNKTQSETGTERVFDTEYLKIPNVPVTDTNHETRGFISRFSGSGTLILSFTYTHCETLCPVTNAILAGVDESLEDDPITIVSISIDPQSDTPTALKESAEALGASDHWVWVTANPSDNRMLLDSLGVDVVTLNEHDPTFLIGDICTGTFTRIIGVPRPDMLLELARSHAPCGG